MTKIDDHISETSDKIVEVKKAIREHSEQLEFQELKETAIDHINDWKEKPFQFPERTVRVGTLFSGIGAIEYAFQRLGLKHKIVFAGDIEPNVKKSYFTNYDINEDDWFTDIRDFDATKYKGNVDFIVGGAPCQAFSSVGHKLGFEDARGTLFYEFARVIKETQPKVFLFENVRGLLTHDNGRTWNVIHDIFEELGYDVKFRILNSCDYGIPQNRRRLYCLGFKEKTEFQYPHPIELKYRMYDFLEDFKDDKFYIEDNNLKFITPRDNGDYNNPRFDEFIFPVNEIPEKYYLSEKMTKFIKTDGTKNFKTSTETDLDVARPLLHSMHKMHRAGIDNYVSHTGRFRKLTPRECLRLMGFRDDFKIVCSDTAMYQQAGNSIVVDVLIALLKQIDITQYGVEENEKPTIYFPYLEFKD